MKLSILAEVNTNGWTLSDVARHHDLTRQHLYQWRRELRLKGLWPDGASEAFVAVELLPAPDDARQPVICDDAAPEIAVILRNGRQLRCRETIAEPTLAQLLRVLEGS